MGIERDKRLDTLKGLLITLVVFGHCFKYGQPSDNVKLIVSNWIYLFHMPFFVFLSGYFSHPRSASFWKGVLAVAESYIVFQLIKGILAGYSLAELLMVPAPMMWYLLALIVWRVMYYIVDQCQRPVWTDTAILVILFALGLVIGFNDNVGRTFALSRLIVFAPFFWMGTMMQGKDFVGICKRIPIWIAISILFFTVIAAIGLSQHEWLNLKEIVRGASGYGEHNPMQGLCSRLSWYVVSVLISVSIIKVVSESKLLNQVGKDSLKYYLFHSVALPFMVLLKLPWNWYFSIIYGVCLMVIMFYFNKTRLSDFAIRPISNIVNYFKHGKSSNNSN